MNVSHITQAEAAPLGLSRRLVWLLAAASGLIVAAALCVWALGKR